MSNFYSVNGRPVVIKTMWIDIEEEVFLRRHGLENEWSGLLYSSPHAYRPLPPQEILIEARPGDPAEDFPPAPSEPEGILDPFHETARLVTSCLPSHLQSCIDVQCSLTLEDNALETWGVVPSPHRRRQEILDIFSTEEGAICLEQAAEHFRQRLSERMRRWMTEQGASEVVINGCIRLG